MKNIAPQISMTHSGGRVKPLPIQYQYIQVILRKLVITISIRKTHKMRISRYRKRLEMQVGSLMYCLDTIMVL
ncbi:hypothetical protein ACVNP0_00295 [Staphylococcus aureus]